MPGRSRTKASVEDALAFGPHDEQARAVARLGGPQRDPVLGQFEVEERDKHSGDRARWFTSKIRPARTGRIQKSQDGPISSAWRR